MLCVVMYFTFLAFLPVIMAVDLEPFGKNVCVVEERFTVPVEVQTMVEEEYRTVEWCFGIPPRCTRYKKHWVPRMVTEERISTRQVPRCCQGFVPNGVDCKAYCQEPCRHGVCSEPDTCHCFPGFRDPLCTAICARGSWGQNCTQVCGCQNDAFCNPMNGVCLCTPGWRGKRCSEPCEDGYFGYECRRPCYCDGSPCHHITGECFYPTTWSTTEMSTTELTTETSTVLQTTSTETSTVLETTSTETSTVLETTSTETSTVLETTSTEILVTSTASTTWTAPTEDIITSTRISTTEVVVVTEAEEAHTLIASNIYNKNNVAVSDETTVRRELAGLVWTITSSVLSSLIILCAIVGLAFLKRRKPPQPPLNTDTGLYRFYAEVPQPVFQNPTYGLRTPEELEQKSDLQTFKNEGGTFELELREILEAQYDHLPARTRTPTPYDHLYDEILYDTERRTNFS